MNKFLRLLQFFRVTDENGNLSLTNIALVVAVANMVQRPEISLVDVAGFVATALGYHAKRAFAPSPQAAADTEALQNALKSLETKVTALQMGQALKKR